METYLNIVCLLQITLEVADYYQEFKMEENIPFISS